MKTPEDQIADLDARIAELVKEREALIRTVLEARSPFRVGDTIEWRGRRGVVARICGGGVVLQPYWLTDDGLYVFLYERPRLVSG
jgi:hypothetical protein